MKILTVLLLFFSFNTFAQSSSKIIKDTSGKFMIVDPKPINNHDKPLYLVDGTIYKGNIRRINPDNILSIDILKQSASTRIFGKQGANGVVLITTKKYATTKYKNKFSSLCEEYKEYLSNHNNDDSKLNYLIDGEIYGHDSKSIEKLYRISINKIVKVSLIKTQDFEGLKTITVGIEIKQ